VLVEPAQERPFVYQYPPANPDRRSREPVPRAKEEQLAQRRDAERRVRRGELRDRQEAS
jgi:hypothetical protein